MSEINLTAAAWLPEGPRVGVARDEDFDMECRWKLRAEVSVADSQ